MGITVLELLADGASGFGGARGLELDDLDKLNDATQVIFLIVLAREGLNGRGDSRVRLLL